MHCTHGGRDRDEGFLQKVTLDWPAVNSAAGRRGRALLGSEAGSPCLKTPIPCQALERRCRRSPGPRQLPERSRAARLAGTRSPICGRQPPTLGRGEAHARHPPAQCLACRLGTACCGQVGITASDTQRIDLGSHRDAGGERGAPPSAGTAAPAGSMPTSGGRATHCLLGTRKGPPNKHPPVPRSHRETADCTPARSPLFNQNSDSSAEAGKPDVTPLYTAANSACPHCPVRAKGLAGRSRDTGFEAGQSLFLFHTSVENLKDGTSDTQTLSPRHVAQGSPGT